ncbi:hypothetical protein [Clostridium sp. DJ247]|uniref:hypothetical protein n=1 Tax=Clostridium sp. DJ247 TaxID=2726188 RepID=UPI00162559E2|nr:hypothetical protein [Clostridium sp. DJ247]MBC2580856.1 hypothetical protein [Clostridium sp. DJ247]
MLGILKEAVVKQIIEMADDKAPVIYENYEVNEKLEIQTYVVIVKISSYGFRIYQGMLHSTGRISTKYMSVDADMFNAISSSLVNM